MFLQSIKVMKRFRLRDLYLLRTFHYHSRACIIQEQVKLLIGTKKAVGYDLVMYGQIFAGQFRD